jgi:hypothetical protein
MSNNNYRENKNRRSIIHFFKWKITHIILAGESGETGCRTVAVESVDEVGAGAVVLAGPALALVDVRLAVPPLEANNAVALVALGNERNLNTQ